LYIFSQYSKKSFVDTAKDIYEKIKQGVFDVSNEVSALIVIRINYMLNKSFIDFVKKFFSQMASRSEDICNPELYHLIQTMAIIVVNTILV
jgi:hypothetical protein